MTRQWTPSKAHTHVGEGGTHGGDRAAKRLDATAQHPGEVAQSTRIREVDEVALPSIDGSHSVNTCQFHADIRSGGNDAWRPRTPVLQTLSRDELNGRTWLALPDTPSVLRHGDAASARSVSKKPTAPLLNHRSLTTTRLARAATAVTSSAGSIGFARWIWKPARSAFTRSSDRA